jgi:predicted DsbA family dithiol-disulfide isomerase
LSAEDAAARLRVRVHYDFASTLCYVAHRVLARLAPALEALGIELAWTPLELSRLVGPYRPGASVDELRRANAARVAAELGVAVRVPRVWPDVRTLGALALLAGDAARGASWRERAFRAVFEEGLVAIDAGAALRLAREVALAPEPAALDAALAELERRTEAAREELVSGVPTFMLGRWPFGGIQSEETLLRVFERYATRARAGTLVEKVK